jgi:hypothetical protein
MLSTYSVVTGLTGEQRREIGRLTQGRPGWRMLITPSHGPARQVEVYNFDSKERYQVDRHGNVTDQTQTTNNHTSNGNGR